MSLPVASGWYSQSEEVDPFPAYMHDLALVRQTATEVETAFPIESPVSIVVLDRESIKRTNGECSILWRYMGDNEPRQWAAAISLWGKRIPPHPAMTRYLVAHEYGHAVARVLADRRGDEELDGLYTEYRRVRNLARAPSHGNGGTWHQAVAEVFANDFRILVAKAESEFWPHAGIPRPEMMTAVQEFWQEAVRFSLSPAV